MPLDKYGERIIRNNLEAIKNGERVRPKIIGSLTEDQLAALNAEQVRRGFQPLIARVMFLGRHLYKRRCIENGYTIEDVIEQISWAMHESSTIYTASKMNVLISQRTRNDAYGNQVVDKIVFECTARHPYPELFSVVPKGDKTKPGTKE